MGGQFAKSKLYFCTLIAIVAKYMMKSLENGNLIRLVPILMLFHRRARLPHLSRTPRELINPILDASVGCRCWMSHPRCQQCQQYWMSPRHGHHLTTTAHGLYLELSQHLLVLGTQRTVLMSDLKGSHRRREPLQISAFLMFY